MSDAAVLRGKPCFRGTRIPVALIFGYLGAGSTVEQTIEEFPDLTPDDIAAAFRYARDLAGYEVAVTP